MQEQVTVNETEYDRNAHKIGDYIKVLFCDIFFLASLYIVLQVLAGVCIEMCMCVYAFILFTMVRLNKMEKNYEFQIWKCFIFHRSIVHSLIYCNAVQQDKGMFQQK